MRKVFKLIMQLSSIKYVFLILLTLMSILYVYYYNNNNNNGNLINFVSMDLTNLTNYKTILYWNSFFDSNNYFGSGTKPFEHCEVSDCYVTSNKLLQSQDEFDAIIFHAAEYSIWRHGKPNKRSFNQRYIFFNLETPISRQIDKYASYYFYNWTMTYLNKSDLFAPYARIIKQSTNYTIPSLSFVTNKTKLAAWFVSNCKTPSKRDKYVKELKKHVNIDIYGNCGPNKCAKKYLNKCYDIIESNYLFYLSFENTFCEDYVTEKLYNLLTRNIVPIVYGLGNYKQLAPPNSVINTGDFKTIKDLANYLIYLKNNPMEYLKYFEWKRDFIVNTSLRSYVMCDLCKKLHTDGEVKVYKDLNKWWSSHCVNQDNIKIPDR